MDNIQISTFGIYHDDEELVLQLPCMQSAKGYTFYAVEPILIAQETSKIPLEIGTAFGITVVIDNDDEESENVYEVQIIHPEMEHPDTEYLFSETFYSIDFTGLSSVSILYILEEKFELMAGFWSFQLVKNNHIILEKEMQTYPVAVMPEEENEEQFFYDMD